MHCNCLLWDPVPRGTVALWEMASWCSPQEVIFPVMGHLRKRKILAPAGPEKWITVIFFPFTVCIRNKSPLARLLEHRGLLN